jgi:hypothetical protein
MVRPNTTPLRIGALGYAVREQLLLRSLVRIAGAAVPGAWEFVDAPPYHALFASPDASDALVAPHESGAFRISAQRPLKSDRIALLLDRLKIELPRLAAAHIAAPAPSTSSASVSPPT